MDDEIDVELTFGAPPSVKLAGKWKPVEKERAAAWELYVELVTRIPVAPLGPDEGVLREALSSLYSLFGTTRAILKTCGPLAAQPKPIENLSFAAIAVTVLNYLVRPVLAVWHPRLLDYEAKNTKNVPAAEYERAWEHYHELRNVIAEMRPQLVELTVALGKAAKVVSLIDVPQITKVK